MFVNNLELETQLTVQKGTSVHVHKSIVLKYHLSDKHISTRKKE